MEPTRAFLDSILKYKTIYCSATGLPGSKFLYPDQEPCLNFAHQKNTQKDVSELQSIECQIMEYADDIAYSIDDIKDGIEARFITSSSIQKWANENELPKRAVKVLRELQKAVDKGIHESYLSKKMGAFVIGCSLRKRSTFMDSFTNRYRYLLDRDKSTEEERELYKRLAKDIVFSTASLHQLEHKGAVLLRRLFETLDCNYQGSALRRLLPKEWHDALCSCAGDLDSRKRTICDFLAGMTDAYAVRMYRRMFEPEYGSLTDLT